MFNGAPLLAPAPLATHLTPAKNPLNLSQKKWLKCHFLHISVKEECVQCPRCPSTFVSQILLGHLVSLYYRHFTAAKTEA